MSPLNSVVENLTANDEAPTSSLKQQGYMQGHLVTSSSSSSTASSPTSSSPIPKRLDMTSFKGLGDVFVGGIKKNTSFLHQSNPSLPQSYSDKSSTTFTATTTSKDSVRKFSVPILPSSLKLKKTEATSSEPVQKDSCSKVIETEVLKVDKVLQEMIETEQTFFTNLSLLEEAYGVFQKKGENFFDFIDEKKPDSKGALRTGLKEKARLALSNLLENAALLKPSSAVLLKVLQASATIEIVAVTFAGLGYQSFETVGENYNKYTSFQRKLTKEEKKEFLKKVNKLLPKETLKKSLLKFEDYAITLVQRPPRYELFLKELQKHAGSLSPQTQAALETALKKIQKGTANMNEKVRYTMLFTLEDLKKLPVDGSEESSDKSESHSSTELSIEVSSSHQN